MAKARCEQSFRIDGRDYSLERVRISYPHIGVQTLMPPAQAKLVRTDVRKNGERIGYIPGAGDDIPESLRQIRIFSKDIERARNHGEEPGAVLRGRSGHSRL